MRVFPRNLKFDPGERLEELRLTLRMFGVRGWTAAVIGAVVTLAVVGSVASLFENPLFSRQLAARTQDYVIWAVTGVLGGLIIGTFAIASDTAGQGKAASGGVLSTLAVGCPICNKLAVMLLGTSGALNFFGPTQIFIGVASVLVLTWTLFLRARATAGSCPIDSAPAELRAGAS